MGPGFRQHDGRLFCAGVQQPQLHPRQPHFAAVAEQGLAAGIMIVAAITPVRITAVN
jgi:hypothetical protein